MTAPSETIRAHLQTAGLVDGISGWTGFSGYFPNTPDRCVAITDTSGPAPEASFAYEEPGIQLRVRGLREDYTLTNTKVTELFDALHGQSINSEYAACWAQGSPIFMSYDTNERPVWSVNFKLMRTR
jgi:hypothetical protein